MRCVRERAGSILLQGVAELEGEADDGQRALVNSNNVGVSNVVVTLRSVGAPSAV